MIVKGEAVVIDGTDSTSRATPAGWPMLPRVLSIVLATVLAVQFANIAFLEFAPLPRPPSATIARVATVLESARYSPSEFRLRYQLTPVPVGEGRSVAQAVALARELGVAPERVGLTIIDPPMIWAGQQRIGSPAGRRPASRDTMVVGDFTAALKLPDGRWRVVQPVRSGMNAWRLRMLAWLLVALFTALPFAWLLGRWVTRPVALFAKAAERIGRNPRTAPLPVQGPREIVHAARAMNEMQRRLNGYVDDRTVLIGALAHDLRTPLMRMALRLERAPDDLREHIERDIAEMQAMIATATGYVRGATASSSREKIDLRSVTESVVDGYTDRGEKVTLLDGGNPIVEGDPVALKAIADNLILNALRYAGDAEVSLRHDATCAVLEVRDHGPGIPEQDLDRVFEPFFRGEQSRNRDTGGMGLGLASVRSTARMHRGEATVSNHPDGGLIARVTLPY